MTAPDAPAFYAVERGWEYDDDFPSLVVWERVWRFRDERERDEFVRTSWINVAEAAPTTSWLVGVAIATGDWTPAHRLAGIAEASRAIPVRP